MIYSDDFVGLRPEALAAAMPLCQEVSHAGTRPGTRREHWQHAVDPSGAEALASAIRAQNVIGAGGFLGPAHLFIDCGTLEVTE